MTVIICEELAVGLLLLQTCGEAALPDEADGVIGRVAINCFIDKRTLTLQPTVIGAGHLSALDV